MVDPLSPSYHPWYTYVDESDLDEIIEEHLKNGRVVERLKI
jgi:(2Fe-2S) ferredoxin